MEFKDKIVVVTGGASGISDRQAGVIVTPLHSTYRCQI